MKLLNLLLGAFALGSSTVLADVIAIDSGAVLGEGQAAEAGRPASWGYRNELTYGPVTTDFKLTKEILGQSMDTPRVYPRPNASSFDWWYFDAVNPANLNESIVVIFYLTTNDSFPLRLTPDNSVSVDVFMNFGDGSAWPILIDSAKSTHPKDYSAILSTDGGPGMSGSWVSTGVSFTGYSDGKRFKVNVNAPAQGVTGTLDIQAVTPGHYPCSSKGNEGESLEAQSHVGWTNIVPDARATVDFTFAGQKLKFDNGLGYHDHKWSDRPFHHSVKNWFWGHGRLGDYSIVWLFSEGHDGKIYSNAYLAHPNGKNVASCENSVSGPVTPNMVIVDTGNAFNLTFSLPGVQKFVMRVEKTKVIGKRGPFTRWTGKISAEIQQGYTLHGNALFQEFHF